jgi:hypothetical protein
MLMAAKMQSWLEAARLRVPQPRLQRPEPQWLHGQGTPAPVRFHGHGLVGNRVLGFVIARGKWKEAWKICLSAVGMGMIGSHEAVTFSLLLTCCLLLSCVRPGTIAR